jgi:hypothetical protein
VSKLHDFDGSQVFGSLGLRARFVASDEQQGGVHDGGTVEHSGHENVVSGTIDKRDMPVNTFERLEQNKSFFQPEGDGRTVAISYNRCNRGHRKPVYPPYQTNTTDTLEDAGSPRSRSGRSLRWRNRV